MTSDSILPRGVEGQINRLEDREFERLLEAASFNQAVQNERENIKAGSASTHTTTIR